MAKKTDKVKKGKGAKAASVSAGRVKARKAAPKRKAGKGYVTAFNQGGR